MSALTAYWFGPADDLLPHGDGRKAEVGVTHRVDGEIVPCRNGLHGSVRVLDALRYATSPIVWGVTLSGTVVPHNDDKHAASERTYLWRFDATDVLERFGRRVALDVIHLWNAPDVVRRYLETGDPGLRDAAEAAAWAARAAAWAAARAAWAAAEARAAWAAAAWAAEAGARAAWSVSADAAWAAAWAVSAEGARAKAQEKYNDWLTAMIEEGRS